MSKFQTVEVTENEDIILVHNGKVVGVIVNSTITVNGTTGYHFIGRGLDNIDPARDVWNQHTYTFSAGSSLPTKAIDIDGFTAEHLQD